MSGSFSFFSELSMQSNNKEDENARGQGGQYAEHFW
jgi:hypothetical protein